MTDLMSQAVDLMIAGMGFVFAFLVVLVFATGLMSKIILRFAPPEPATPASRPRAKPKAPTSVNPDTAEAIKKAIAQYRARHKK
ncbi:OadG family protein [Marinobacter oulmenensis]|uniref:Probable oxaloacetate decarboxylase gamma chain n=1 Tax=Marinobacter oulmenensis TaxID=643747 RepID=A0A840UCK5_9GAMM|nr:OadG family transporter subunit [Marinobacter oulmenensis]MBB5322762.1 oxaloacetate decarboxylase gamma subunit [Marinobacter oulmenensis]